MCSDFLPDNRSFIKGSFCSPCMLERRPAGGPWQSWMCEILLLLLLMIPVVLVLLRQPMMVHHNTVATIRILISLLAPKSYTLVPALSSSHHHNNCLVHHPAINAAVGLAQEQARRLHVQAYTNKNNKTAVFESFQPRYAMTFHHQPKTRIRT